MQAIIKYFKLIPYYFKKITLTPKEWAEYLGVNIGNNNFIGKNHWSSEPYLISIGSNCQLTNCKIFTHGGGQPLRDLYPNFDAFGKVKIGDWAYIGYNSLIMPGVTIGDHVLVAAGSVVTKSIPAYSVVAGNPAKVICNIEEFKRKNLKWNINTKSYSNIDKKNYILSLNEEMFIKKPYINNNDTRCS